jgi:molecular chaperone DnaK (HSP70)
MSHSRDGGGDDDDGKDIYKEDCTIGLSMNNRDGKGGEGSQMGDIKHTCSATSVLSIAEQTKKLLSSQNEVSLYCSLASGDGDKKSKHDISVTRDEFEDKCSLLFDRVLRPVDDLLQEALMPRSEVRKTHMIHI